MPHNYVQPFSSIDCIQSIGEYFSFKMSSWMIVGLTPNPGNLFWNNLALGVYSDFEIRGDETTSKLVSSFRFFNEFRGRRNHFSLGGGDEFRVGIKDSLKIFISHLEWEVNVARIYDLPLFLYGTGATAPGIDDLGIFDIKLHKKS
ncbi:MAG: hypothetical protein F6K40_12215 [Okeania sp. SIO3I5]|uniref:hypothetical protein n=1 Tax=Okeania sp. SIO3I5 TaxID=2607805 RepID=UPI0013B8A21A|nr:hypothetical protein [Okeania sp. SIO3I5]NEQ36994.1 hypothetical protein [Okeania sp. SIO3I5]